MKFRANFWSGLLGISLAVATEAALAETATFSSEQLAAVRGGNAAQLRAALNEGLSPNARDAAGNTPLMHAAMYGDVSCLRLLLDRGADVNATNAAGATALIRAAYHFEKVRLLVEGGADVNARSRLGNTPLILAARPANSHRTVEYLLSRSANAKAVTEFGATALMAACAGGDEKSVRLLIKAGADINAQPTPTEPGFVFGGGRSALMWAAFRGNTDLLKLLLDAGADVNAVDGLGTALSQAAWASQTRAARLLLQRGARVDLAGPVDGYTPLHWAASTEERDPAFVKLLLQHGADPNSAGGENVGAFLGTMQTPLMLAQRRGQTEVLATLKAGGATNGAPDRATHVPLPGRALPSRLDDAMFRGAIAQALPPLEDTALISKRSFLRHGSRQDCVSCHSQHMPMAAFGAARSHQVGARKEVERELVEMVGGGEFKDPEPDLQPLFHPEAAHTKGYAAFAFAAQDLAPDEHTDAWVHHLSAIQGEDGQWFNNLPRPPIQTGDIGATALAVQALQRYSLPGRKEQFSQQVARARQWLWKAKPQNTEGRIYQILGLSWSGESPRKLRSFAQALLSEQRADGGWAQLPGLKSDAYATAQAIYALRVGAGFERANPAVDRGLRFLVSNQLEDGTWHVRRRAFPFQPTMHSGFPHGRDAWISTAATSWAVLALSLPEQSLTTARR